MTSAHVRRANAHRFFVTLSVALATVVGQIAYAQGTTESGFVRVDDMLLPRSAWHGADISRPASVTAPSFTPWPGGLVPIEFSGTITETNRSAVFAACAIWSKRASVSCVARTTQQPYLRVTADGGGCYANLGAYAGRDPARMNLDTNCWGPKSILHELGHVFGLHHEHQRPDREAYISIDTSAVDPTYQHAFTPIGGAPTRGAYDFFSVMHYHDFAFAARPLTRTMIPKPGFEWYTYSLGGSDFPSPGDGDAVQAIYGGGAAYWPARAQNLRVYQTSPAGTTIVWDPPVGGPEVTQYWIMVYSGPSYLESSVVQTFNVGPASTGVTLNLQSGHYFMTVKGDSADGEYARSTVLTFTVSGVGASTQSVPGSPTLEASPAGGDRVALTWHRGPGAAPTLYTMYAGTTPGSNNLGSFPMGTSTSLITTAPAGVTAYMRIVASNEVGGATSNEVSFYVPSGPSASAPSLSVQNAAANPVSLSWSSGNNAQATYTLLAGTAPGAVDLGTFPVGHAQSIVANAPVGVPLYIRVAAIGPTGTAISNEVHLQVPASWAAQPPTLQAPAILGSTVALAWSRTNATAYTLVARLYQGGPVLASIPLGGSHAISIPNVPRGSYWVTIAATPGFAESNPVLVCVS